MSIQISCPFLNCLSYFELYGFPAYFGYKSFYQISIWFENIFSQSVVACLSVFIRASLGHESFYFGLEERILAGECRISPSLYIYVGNSSRDCISPVVPAPGSGDSAAFLSFSYSQGGNGPFWFISGIFIVHLDGCSPLPSPLQLRPHIKNTWLRALFFSCILTGTLLPS